MIEPVPFRIVGHYNSCPVFLRTYPTYIELSCHGKSWRFRTYNEAMTYLQTMTRNKVRERKDHDRESE